MVPNPAHIQSAGNGLTSARNLRLPQTNRELRKGCRVSACQTSCLSRLSHRIALRVTVLVGIPLLCRTHWGSADDVLGILYFSWLLWEDLFSILSFLLYFCFLNLIFLYALSAIMFWMTSTKQYSHLVVGVLRAFGKYCEFFEVCKLFLCFILEVLLCYAEVNTCIFVIMLFAGPM